MRTSTNKNHNIKLCYDVHTHLLELMTWQKSPWVSSPHMKNLYYRQWWYTFILLFSSFHMRIITHVYDVFIYMIILRMKYVFLWTNIVTELILNWEKMSNYKKHGSLIYLGRKLDKTRDWVVGHLLSSEFCVKDYFYTWISFNLVSYVYNILHLH